MSYYEVIEYEKRSKYRNKRTKIDGIWFDSMIEANRYSQLRLLEKAKEISDLTVHPIFELQPSFIDASGKKQKAIRYEADFQYKDKAENWNIVVEDVKGMRTKDYLLKKKMFLFKYQTLIFKEIKKEMI